MVWILYIYNSHFYILQFVILKIIALKFCSINLELILGFIGTVVSLTLAFWEFYKFRIRFYISCFWTGNPEDDDVIVVYNDSNRSVVINHFDIFYTRSNKERKEIDLGRDGEFSLLSIAPGAAHKIQISNQYKFNITSDKKIYLSLYVMGIKKPFILPIN